MVMKLVKRSFFGWPQTAAPFAKLSKGLVIHYDGSTPPRKLTQKTHDHCVAYWKEIRRFHMNSHGWLDIGYSYGVCPHGFVFEGRGVDRQQAAEPGGNSTYYSSTLMLCDGEVPTSIQIEATRELRKWLMDNHGNAGVVKGHRDFNSTSCPGDILYKMVRDGTFTKIPHPPTPWVPGKVWPYGKGIFMHNGWGLSEGVKAVQKKLNLLGWIPKLNEDGLFGDKTETAVRWFQKNHKLKVTGMVGPAEWKVLFS